MIKIISTIGVTLGLFILLLLGVSQTDSSTKLGLSTFQVIQGGTGATTLTGCLTGNGTSAITGTGSACGTGTFAWPFTAFTNYVSTSTTVGFLNGLFSTASSTFSAPFRLSSLSDGELDVYGGLVSSSASTTFSSPLVYTSSTKAVTCPTCNTSIPFVFPFTVNTNYNSTTTAIGFLNGLFSTASSTFSSNLFLTGLNSTQGVLYTGSVGKVNTLATSTLSGSGLISVTAGAYILGGTPIVVSCSTCGAGTVTAVTGTWPIISSDGTTPNITWGGLSTSSAIVSGQSLYATGVNTVASVATSTLGVTSPITFSGTLGYQVGGANGSFACATCAVTGTTITINGTTNQITSSAGAQDLSANRTWTLSFPNQVIFPQYASTTNGFSTPYASSTTYFGANLTTCNSASNALTWASGVFGCNSISGSGSSQWATSTAPVDAIYNSAGNGGGYVGIGTTTPRWTLNVASSTKPQIALTDSTNSHWTFRNAGGNFYLATASPTTLATSTLSALSILSNNNVGIATDTPFAKLSITQNVGQIALAIGSTTKTNILVDQIGNFKQNVLSPKAMEIQDGSANDVMIVDTTQNSTASGIEITAGSAQSSDLFDIYGSDGTTKYMSVGSNGLYTHFGASVSNASPNACASSYCLEYVGSDNTTAGVGIAVQNINSGTSAYGGYNLYNDTGGSITTGFGGLYLTSSNYTDTTFGTAFATKSQLQLQSAIGSIIIGTGTTTASAGNISFVTAGFSTTNERMRIDNIGHLLVGTTTAPLGNGRWLVDLATTTVPQLVLQGANTNNIWTMRSIGNNFYIATASPTTYATSSKTAFWLDTNGGMNTSNITTCNGATNALGVTANLISCDSGVSDIRLKKDIKTLDDGLDVVMKLKPVSFYWKDLTNHNTTDPREQVGFVAQDVEKIIPTAVEKSPDDYLTVDKTKIIPYLVDAVQKLAVNKGMVVKRSVEENYQWIVMGLLVIWNLYLTIKIKKKKHEQ